MPCGRTGAGQGQRRVGVQGNTRASAGAVREPRRRRDRGAVLGMVSRRQSRPGTRRSQICRVVADRVRSLSSQLCAQLRLLAAITFVLFVCFVVNEILRQAQDDKPRTTTGDSRPADHQLAGNPQSRAGSNRRSECAEAR